MFWYADLLWNGPQKEELRRELVVKVSGISVQSECNAHLWIHQHPLDCVLSMGALHGIWVVFSSSWFIWNERECWGLRLHAQRPWASLCWRGRAEVYTCPLSTLAAGCWGRSRPHISLDFPASHLPLGLGQNTGAHSLSLLQGIFLTQGSNPGLLHCRQILYQLSHKRSP